LTNITKQPSVAYYNYHLHLLVNRISVCAALNLAMGMRSIGQDSVEIPYSLKKSIDLWYDMV